MNVVSFGGGTNSTAMIIGMYLHKIPIDLILFADTGGEQPHTYEFIETFNGWLEKHGLPQITSVQYHDKDGNRLTLEQECINSGTLPSIAYGFKRCSLKHKIGTQEKFCNNYQPCKEVWASGQRVQKYIGYDAGETRRIQHAAPIDEADKKYEKHYPLYEWGWTREECVRVIERAGLPKPGKSSCFFCPSMKKKEIQALWENYPDLFQRAIALEHGSAARNVNVKGLGRNWSWESYYNEFMENKAFEDAQITFDELFPDSPGGCLCGAPCGCYDGYRNDLGYFQTRPNRPFMGHDVAQAPEYFTARVLKTSPMKALTGKGRLSKGFLVEFKSGHVGMVQRIVGTGRFHYTVRSGAPSTSDKMQTMGSPSAAAMHSTIWPEVEPEVELFLAAKLTERAEQVLARAKRKA